MARGKRNVEPLVQEDTPPKEYNVPQLVDAYGGLARKNPHLARTLLPVLKAIKEELIRLQVQIDELSAPKTPGESVPEIPGE